MTGNHRGPGLWERLRRWYDERWGNPVERPWWFLGERWEAARRRTWKTWRR